MCDRNPACLLVLPTLRANIFAEKLDVLHAYNPNVLGGLRWEDQEFKTSS